MKKTRKITAVIIALVIILSFGASVCCATYYYGSTDYDTVGNIQRKLKNWGYYDGAVDGIFGYRTEQAVRYFQQKNGLAVDGKVGTQTLKALGIYTSSSSSSSGSSSSGSSSSSSNSVSAVGSYSSSDVQLLARCIYGEARGESYTGKVAVGAVIINRVRSSSFPNSVSGVIYQNGAFDAVSDGQINLTPSDECVKAARDAMNGWDPSGGAIYYYNPSTATNSWIRSRPIVARIGNHVFCK